MRTRTVTSNGQGYFVVSSLKPATYTIKVEKAGFAAIEYTAMPVAVGQELTLDFELKPAGVQEQVTVVGVAPILDISSAQHGRERQRARGAGPAGQRPADVAADAAGARLAERRHRHVAGHSLLADAPSSRTSSSTTASKASAIIDAAPGVVERRKREPLQAPGEPRERAGVPRRVERLPGRVRHRHRRTGQRHHQVGRQHRSTARCSSTCATTSSTPPTTSTRSATPTAASSLKPAARRRCRSRR